MLNKCLFLCGINKVLFLSCLFHTGSIKGYVYISRVRHLGFWNNFFCFLNVFVYFRIDLFRLTCSPVETSLSLRLGSFPDFPPALFPFVDFWACFLFWPLSDRIYFCWQLTSASFLNFIIFSYFFFVRLAPFFTYFLSYVFSLNVCLELLSRDSY